MTMSEHNLGNPGWLVIRNLPANCRRCKRCGFDLCIRKIPWRRKWQPTPVFLLEKSQGQRSLADYRPWGCKRVGHN